MYGCRPRQSVVWSHSVIAFWWGRFSLREERLVRFQLTDFHSKGSGADEGMGYYNFRRSLIMAKKILFDENGNEVKGKLKKPIYKRVWFCR